MKMDLPSLGLSLSEPVFSDTHGTLRIFLTEANNKVVITCSKVSYKLPATRDRETLHEDYKERAKRSVISRIPSNRKFSQIFQAISTLHGNTILNNHTNLEKTYLAADEFVGQSIP